MADNSKAFQDMEESFARFKMDDEEEGGISYEEDTEKLSEIDVRWCLVGRFLTDSPIDFQAMQHRMAALWRPGKGVYIKEVDRSKSSKAKQKEVREVVPSGWLGIWLYSVKPLFAASLPRVLNKISFRHRPRCIQGSKFSN